MPISEKGYAHWDGHFKKSRYPWWPITRLGIKLAFKKKYFKFVFSTSLLPAVVFLVGIYVSERVQDFRFILRGSQQILEVNPGYFRTYFASDFLLFMTVMIMVFSGAGLIADDLKFNSLQLYFSRPIRKGDYFLGKSATLLFFILILTLAPGLIFILAKLIFSGNFRFLGSYPWLPLSVAGYSIFLALFFSLYTLFLSALSRNRRYVAILIFAVYLFSDILFGIFYGNFRTPYLALLSLKCNIQQMGAFFFKQKPPYPIPWFYSLLILGAICVLAGLVLKKRIRGVEIIK